MYKLILLLIILLTFNNSYAADTVKITNGEWPPYLSEKLPGFGKVSQITTEAFKHSGITAEYTFFSSWTRALEEARKGEDWLGTVVWAKNEERSENFFYSDPLMILDDTFFYLKGSGFDWETVEDLSIYRIGMTRGYYYGELIDTAEKTGKIYVERTNKESLNFLKLVRERVDLVGATTDVGYSLIKQNLSNAEARLITHHPRPFRSVSYHLLISKKAKDAEQLIKKFNVGVRNLRENGRYDEIYNLVRN